ncbi:hypothetical protein [Variovorax sp. KK3]|nr:hypothetical protein [Variovorax sp. KK3]
MKLIEPLSAKTKLLESRAALLEAMGYREQSSATGGTARVLKLQQSEGTSKLAAIATGLRRSAVGRWWKRHPLSGAVELMHPLLEGYAHRHPAKLIAYGAGAGALLWVLKPWRLLSTATFVALLFRASNVSALISEHVMRIPNERSGE